MRALVYQGPRDLRLEELPEPEPAAGEILVTVAGCGVCGSDLHGFLGHSSARRPPLVLGHEIAGTVTAVGEGVADGLLGTTVSRSDWRYPSETSFPFAPLFRSGGRSSR